MVAGGIKNVNNIWDCVFTAAVKLRMDRNATANTGEKPHFLLWSIIETKTRHK